MQRELNAIVAYCNDARFLHWPLSAVYHQLRRDGVAAFTLSTFYKYVSLLHLKRTRATKRRKNHHTGIRATAPLQILHADSTVFKTADNHKNYIYLIQDNFSRTILGYRVATECKARFSFDNLAAVRQQYLIPAGIESCQFITDDGPENASPVKELVVQATGPVITHLIAQCDIEFSNSMIEAANKQLKYRSFYHQHIPDHEALVQYVREAVQEYNNRPHHVLDGLTPLEVLNGSTYDKSVDQQQVRLAKTIRITENKTAKCCNYSF